MTTGTGSTTSRVTTHPVNDIAFAPAPVPQTAAVLASTPRDSLASRVLPRINGFAEGFSVPSPVANDIAVANRHLVASQNALDSAKQVEQNAAADEKAAYGSLNIWDKYFRWLPFGHDKAKIATWKQAKATTAGAEDVVKQATAQVKAADGSVDDIARKFLRSSPYASFSSLEQDLAKMTPVREAAQTFDRSLKQALSAIDGAITAKRWDNMSDSMNANSRANSHGHSHGHSHMNSMPSFGGSNGTDFNDMRVMQAKSDAQAAIARADGQALVFRNVLDSYRHSGQQLFGSVGTIGASNVGPGIFDYFVQDNTWIGFMQINDMENTRVRIQGVVAQLDVIESQINQRVSTLRDAMNQQVNALRSAF